MPVYNAGEYLAEAIESILDQTYQNFEFIILDDASTDSSWKIIQSYKRRYLKIIRAYRLKKNLNRGGDTCANIAISKAHGTFIARMDADDIAHPKRLEKQVAYLVKNPQVAILGTQAYVINKQGRSMGVKSVPQEHNEIYQNYAIFHPLIHPTVMMRKNQMPKRKSFYKIKYSANNDLYTFIGMLKNRQFANLPEKLLYYRVHGANDSLTKPKERFFNTLKIRLEAVKYLGYRPSLKNVFINIAQAAVIFVLPEIFIVPVYLYMKGIVKPVLKIPLSLPTLSGIKSFVY